MLSAQQTRSGVPTDQQSVLPTVRGVPWWGAVAIALVPTVIGAIIDGSGKSELSTTYRVLYFIGCVAAVLLVRRRSLFTAITQTPLIAFGVALVTLYALESDTSSGLRTLIINVLLPIAKAFPLMAWTFVIVLILGLGRWFLTRTPSDAAATKKKSPRRAAPSRPSRSSRSDAPASDDTRRADRPSARSGRRDVDSEAPADRPTRREAPTKHSSGRDRARTPRRTSDEPTRVTPTRRRVDGPTAGREPIRSTPRDDPRESRPRPTGHRRSTEPPAPDSNGRDPIGRDPIGRDQSLGRREPRRPRSEAALDELRPTSAPRARYRGVNP